MRQLASIQRIRKLEPIAGADAIVKASVLGWDVVVKKGEFQAGDLCVYCEIDSLLPDKPAFAFLQAYGMRIRTVRLRGQISQGICFPLSVLPDGVEPVEGKEVTEALGVRKYEPPMPANLAGIAKGPFPAWFPKTDETRVQILQDRLDAFHGKACYVTEKLDGSSATYYWRDSEFGVCSRNLELLPDPKNSLWKFAEKTELAKKLSALDRDIALQGEIVGEGIQGNKYGIKGQTVYFFNAFDIQNYSYLGFQEFQALLSTMGLESVPVLERNYALTNKIAELVQLSIGKSVLKPVRREGLVIRPLEEQRDAAGRVSFKVINPEFLLKYE
ncbi:MAG: RNA ligase (ATP) [Saprospiraceae bacterium]|nr:RNA ligase (ATP) [Saprospiraceae bacterium]